MTGNRKKNKNNELLGPKKESFKLALVYLSAGLLWILLSDRILRLFIDDLNLYSNIQTYKGWFYVFATAILIYVLIYKRALIIKRAFDDLKESAYTDNLTKLPNKSAFLNVMTQSIKENNKFSIIYIDLDNFRFINDTLGHKAGDDYLCFISKGLLNIKNENEFIARLGGDEFGVIFPGTMDKNSISERTSEIVQSFGKFWKQENHQYFISFSIGSATYPEDGISSYEMYKNANIAMNKGKKSGKNTLVFFEDVELKNVTENVELANDLQKALESGELFLHYQPVYNLKTMEVEGLEALIRWKNLKRGFVPPDLFIPVAEETGQILNIDRWVLTKVLDMKKKLEDEGSKLELGLNLSSKTLMSEVNFPHFIGVFDDFNVDFSNVVIEITETAVIDDINLAVRRIHELKEKGVRIALDDFGTGYSSLNHLKNLPIDIVKLDRSFIGSIFGDNKEGLIIKGVISLSKNLGFRVIAEGIENGEQLKYLQENDCPFGQGYYLSPPNSIEKIL